MSKVLIISSQVHQLLAEKQLNACIELAKELQLDYQIEKLNAGTYEIPFVIQAYQRQQPFAAYIALGLLINKNLAHYDYIMSHIKYCFTHFALNNVIVGNGIIAGNDLEELNTFIHSMDPCVSSHRSAVKAVAALIRFNTGFSSSPNDALVSGKIVKFNLPPLPSRERGWGEGERSLRPPLPSPLPQGERG